MRAMGIRALFFDFDGVLWDSEVASFRAWQETFATFDEDYLLEEFVTRIGAMAPPIRSRNSSGGSGGRWIGRRSTPRDARGSSS
jgi:beta-phosphoglucomutase-like phosphatase (HAD superfamily)